MEGRASFFHQPLPHVFLQIKEPATFSTEAASLTFTPQLFSCGLRNVLRNKKLTGYEVRERKCEVVSHCHDLQMQETETRQAEGERGSIGPTPFVCMYVCKG